MVGRLTGLAYTLTNSELRARVHEITKDSYEIGVEWLRTFDERGLPMPAEVLGAIRFQNDFHAHLYRPLTTGITNTTENDHRGASLGSPVAT